MFSKSASPKSIKPVSQPEVRSRETITIHIKGQKPFEIDPSRFRVRSWGGERFTVRQFVEAINTKQS